MEEAYETLDAIDSGNDERIADELGDVLLQVVFHGRIGQDHGTFTDLDITTAICKKILYRHPHIFGDAACPSADDVAANWEQLKKREKHLETVTDAMKDVSPSLPALMRAAKVQHKAKQVGFDWDTPQDALQKVHEEADEVRQELDAQGKPGEELGDLLFSCVNVARLCGEQPELLLKSATEKFIHRFEAMENLLKQDGNRWRLDFTRNGCILGEGQSVIRTHLLLNPASGRRLSGGVFPVGNFSRVRLNQAV